MEARSLSATLIFCFSSSPTHQLQINGFDGTPLMNHVSFLMLMAVV